MKKYQTLLDKVQKVANKGELDLSAGEDLSIGIMNLVSIEEHLFFTSQKTGDNKYLELLNEVRLMRTELLKKIIKEYEGEVWCISKHLLAASMRMIEVGTKELKKGNQKEAENLFDKGYKLYNLFWGLNLNVIDVKDVKRSDQKVNLINETGQKKATNSVFDKLGILIKKAVDCCKE